MCVGFGIELPGSKGPSRGAFIPLSFSVHVSKSSHTSLALSARRFYYCLSSIPWPRLVSFLSLLSALSSSWPSLSLCPRPPSPSTSSTCFCASDSWFLFRNGPFDCFYQLGDSFTLIHHIIFALSIALVFQFGHKCIGVIELFTLFYELSSQLAHLLCDCMFRTRPNIPGSLPARVHRVSWGFHLICPGCCHSYLCPRVEMAVAHYFRF